MGDVHGDLERLFRALQPYPATAWRTVFLGDLVDGGPFGVGALRFARDRPNSEVLLGNHEVMMLGALAEARPHGPLQVSWLGAGGQLHDLQELARDAGLQAWLRRRPALLRLDDGSLAQHCDSDGYARLVTGASDPVAAVNDEVARLLGAGKTDLLWDLMTARNVFRRQPMRLESWLGRTGARRVIHGHSPHSAAGPDSYAGGRAICFDGGLGRHGGRRGRGPGPPGATVAPLPAR